MTIARPELLIGDVGVLGLPAVSLPTTNPVGEPDGLPVGAQLVGPPGGDLDLLTMAATIGPITRHQARQARHDQ